MGKPKRVLHVVSAMNRGGAETLLMNVYRNIDKSKVQFDFVSHRPEPGDYDEEILALGGKVYRTNSLGKVGSISYIKGLLNILSNEKYIAVHAHTDYQSGFPVIAAKLKGIKKRVCHSHSNSWDRGFAFKEKITLTFLRTLIKCFATDYCACSLEAARFLYGRKFIDHGKVILLKNGIDVSQFENTGNNWSLRDEINLPNKVKIIGHVGTFSASKNHQFILKVLREKLTKDEHFVVVLVGEGPLRQDIEKEAEKMGVSNHIRFLGVRTDIPRLMKEFDVFLFPSIFEGFGIVTLEAQCAGTPCVVSDAVPKSTDMDLGLMSFVSLNDSIDKWSKEIDRAISLEELEERKIIHRITESGFDIRRNVDHWLALYEH
ncbi:glycosyltransferase family 1 protein [Ammoniphilus sp. YIM 78166]|uniref:glycosyltransferase family 1 protein n=1 Tax=Ammoniphilus sp. YIM 78166 TaxID=1644106 RepID=UPI0010703205|nr:glycosyltransferase family 1 protein [Ammoniphilus sp. YIM 78166]